MRLRVTVPLIALAMAGIGCAPEPTVLARVGDDLITTDDLVAAGEGLERNYPFPADTAKRRLLDDLVRRALLERQARALGYDREPGYALAVARTELPYLTDALFKDEVGGAPKVSDDEVRAFYRQRGTETHARLMYIADAGGARNALEALRAGEDFGAVADRHSVPGSVPSGGDVGYLPPGTLMDPLDDYLRTKPAGWVSEAVPAPGHAFIVMQVLDRRPREQPAFAAESTQLRDMLSQRKQRVLAQRILENLRRQYHVRPSPGGTQFLFQKLTPLRAPSFLGPDARPTMPSFTDEEYARPLVEWDGGRYTVREALDDLQTASQRPMLSMLPQIQEFVESQALQRVAVSEARRRGLHLKPDLAARLKGRRAEWLVNRLYERQVVPRARVEDWQLRQIFERRQREFVVTDEVRIRHVAAADSALAESLAAGSRAAGGGLAQRAQALGLRCEETTVRVAQHPPRWSELEDLFTTMSPGQIAGPLPHRGGWLVVELLARREHLPTWERLDGLQQRSVAEEALSQQREAIFAALIDSLRAVTRPLAVHEEGLKRVPWPLRPAGAPASAS